MDRQVTTRHFRSAVLLQFSFEVVVVRLHLGTDQANRGDDPGGDDPDEQSVLDEILPLAPACERTKTLRNLHANPLKQGKESAERRQKNAVERCPGLQCKPGAA